MPTDATKPTQAVAFTPWESGDKPERLYESDDGPNFSGGDWNVFPTGDEGGPVAIASTGERAALIAAACSSYRKHFGPNAVQAAEGDVLGELIDAMQWLHDEAHDIAGQGGLNWRARLQEACARARDALSLIPQQEASK